MCSCGANYADGHAPDCEYVQRLVRDIQCGKAKVVFGGSGSDFVDIRLLRQPLPLPAEPTWEQIHGLNEYGEFENHQPECNEYR